MLLFSDSRQKAAILARDLTRSSDATLMQKVVTLAARELQACAQIKPAYGPQRQAKLSLLYVVFLKVVVEHKLRFFYGEDEQELAEHLKLMVKICREHNLISDEQANQVYQSYGSHHDSLNSSWGDEGSNDAFAVSNGAADSMNSEQDLRA